jgi:hypothetical protein
MLLLIVSLSMAGAQGAAAAPAPLPTPPVKAKRICHMEDAITGSITPKRICVTVPQQAAPAPQKPAQEADREKQPQPAPDASGTSN